MAGGGKAAEGRTHSKTLARGLKGLGEREASWSAASPLALLDGVICDRPLTERGSVTRNGVATQNVYALTWRP